MVNADIGHNQAPEPTTLERAEDLVIVANRWITERPEITDTDMAAKARDFVEQLRVASKALDADKATEKEPHKIAVAAIDARYRQPTSKIALALDAMRLLLTRWADVLQARQEAQQKAKIEEARAAQHAAEKASLEADSAIERGGNPIEARLAAQEAQERAAEAIVAVAEPPAPIRIAGEYSARSMGVRTQWNAQIENEAAALRHFAKHPEVRAAALEACLKLATQMARKSKDASKAPPGFKFIPTKTAV